MFLADAQSNIVIKGLTFNGNRSNQNTPLETYHAVRLLNSTNVTIENNIIHDCCGDGVTLGGYINGTASSSNVNKDVTIQNNQIYNNGRNGISCIHVDGAVILNNKIYNQQAWVSTLGSGIDIEPNAGTVGLDQYICRNITASKNKIYNNNIGIQIYVVNGFNANHIIENIDIEGNKIFRNNNRTSLGNSMGIYGSNIGYSTTSSYSDIKINNNQIYENGYDGSSTATGSHGIFLVTCAESLMITNNQLRRSYFGIELNGCKKQKISDNRISGFGDTTDGVGIILRTTESSQIELNTISNPAYNNTGAYGIGIIANDSSQISKDNVISNNIIYDNRATSWMKYGIKLFSSAAGEIITANSLQMNVFRNVSSTQPINVTSIGTNNILLHIQDNALKVFRASQLISFNHEVSIANTTVNRPSLNMQTGFRFFDTSLNKPIWRNTLNSGWTDATGMTITSASYPSGINVSVSSAATTLSVTGLAEPDANYKVSVTPAWNTTYWVTGKTASGFTINFGTAPASASTLDWFASR
jgi:parallel beta-helix repeat protein